MSNVDPDISSLVERLRRTHEVREDGRRLERYRDIWQAITHDDDLRKLPHHVQIIIAPKIPGCGRAAKRAGF